MATIRGRELTPEQLRAHLGDGVPAELADRVCRRMLFAYATADGVHVGVATGTGRFAELLQLGGRWVVLRWQVTLTAVGPDESPARCTGASPVDGVADGLATLLQFAGR